VEIEFVGVPIWEEMVDGFRIGDVPPGLKPRMIIGALNVRLKCQTYICNRDFWEG
jgi:hypothetical protein